MLKNIKWLVCLGAVLVPMGCILAQTAFEDRVFDENIQSVLLFPEGPDISAQTNPPVVSLNGAVSLMLHFDDIAYEAAVFSAKIIHCNVDWTPSRLRDADFLQQYNEFNVNQYEYAINTRVPFIHYTFAVPRVTKSGNYILKVYRGRDESQTVFTKKFRVFQNQVTLGAAVVPPSRTQDRMDAQQINVNVNYSNRELFDPLNATKLVIRQNQRDDSAIIGLKPTSIREDRREIQFQLFDGSNTFDAGNEFRFVDLRFVRTVGRNITAVRMEEDVVFAEAGIETPREGQGYLQYLDLNGQFIIMNAERQNHHLESEYILLTLNLKTPQLPEPPHVLGALTNWGLTPDAKMVYDQKKGMYQSTLFLKQGWYDYQYALKTPQGWNTETLEGSHFQTENEYEVFFYYREMGSRYDELIGYAILNPNKRRL
jgi:hypothetical protein